MSKQATLGPIDPSVTSPLNPSVPGANPDAKHPVSVEAINGYLELAKEMGIKDGDNNLGVLQMLTAHVHPLVLGSVFRTRSQIRMMGKRLLLGHMSCSEAKIDEILDFLCSESGSHDYTINRSEARDVLGLNVETPSEDLYNLMWGIHNDIAEEMELRVPFEPGLNISTSEAKTSRYQLVRGLVESIEVGAHRYLSEGTVTPVNLPDGQLGLRDRRHLEGWKHERP